MKELGATQREVLDFFNDTTGRRFLSLTIQQVEGFKTQKDWQQS